MCLARTALSRRATAFDLQSSPLKCVAVDITDSWRQTVSSRSSQTFFTLWSGRSIGSDPRAHAWFDTGENLLRLCDGVTWAGAPEDVGLGYCVPCRACALAYAEDQVHGRAILRYGTSFPRDYASDSYTVVPSAEVQTGMIESASQWEAKLGQPGANPMPKTTMTRFADFCTTTPNRQRRIVSDERELAEHPEWIRSRDFYGPLRDAIKRTHVANQDLEVFRDSLPALMHQRMRDNQRARFLPLGQAYLDLWGGWDATPFPGQRAEVNLAGLTVIVNPDLRIRTHAGEDILVKLRFSLQPLPPTNAATISYLMHLAKETQGWPQTWQMGILDIERGTLLPAVTVGLDFAAFVNGHAETYMEMWRASEPPTE